MNCDNCGGVIAPSQKFCDDCGTPVNHRPVGVAPPEAAGPPVREPQAEPAWKPRVPAREPQAVPVRESQGAPGGTVARTLPGSPLYLGDGEHLCRAYRAVQLRSSKSGEGTLYVTDARIVFFAQARGGGAQRTNAIMQQAKLEDVTGLYTYVTRRLDVILIGLTCVFALATLVALISHANILETIFLVLLTAGGVCALLVGGADRSGAGVRIYSRMTQGHPIQFGDFRAHGGLIEFLVIFFLWPFLLVRRFFSPDSAFDVMVGRPGPDSERIIAELGALVLDLQTRGLLAAEHWGVAIGEMPARSGSTS